MALNTYSALVEIVGTDKKVRRFWTSMIKGGRAAAKKAMAADPRILECSIYRNSRFVRTLKNNSISA